jgi:hypothetical protein
LIRLIFNSSYAEWSYVPTIALEIELGCNARGEGGGDYRNKYKQKQKQTIQNSTFQIIKTNKHVKTKQNNNY